MPIDPLPVVPASGDPDFNPKADLFWGAMPNFRTQMNAMALSFGPGAPWCSSAGTADAITLSSGLSIGSLLAGQSVSWVAALDNTGPTTLKLDALAAVAAVTPLGAALPAGWINAGEIMSATYNGTAWVVYPSQAYLDAREAVASLFDDAVASTASYDKVFGTAWRSIEIDLHNVVPATNGATLRMRLGNGSGTMETGASDYEYEVNQTGSATASSLPLSSSLANTAGLGLSGTVKIFGAQAATTRTRVLVAAPQQSSGGSLQQWHLDGGRAALAQHQSFSLFMSSGNLVAERITVRGVR